MKKIAIVGGGLLGMCLAYYLAKDGAKVTLIEKSDELGGLASGFEINGFPLEKYYHHLFKSDKAITELIIEMGLGNELKWLKSKVGVFSNNKIYDFSTSLSLIKFPRISFFNRIRGGLVSLYLQKIKNVESFEKFTALGWCNKYFGKEFTNIIWKPLLLAKFGERYFDKISMAWLWTRIHDRSSSRRGLFDYEYLGYLDKSFNSLIQKIKVKLKEMEVEIMLKTEVINHEKIESQHMLKFGNGNYLFDSVIVTTSPEHLVSKFKIPESYKEKVDKIEFLGAICFIFKLNRSFSQYYWLNITEPDFPFLAVVEHTNFVDKALFKGSKVLYIAKYLKSDDELFNLNEEKLFNIYVEYLKKVNPDFDKTWVDSKYYFKTSYAQHVVPVGYKPVPYETGIKGLYFVNFSQIYPHDRGMNYAVVQAREVANMLKNK